MAKKVFPINYTSRNFDSIKGDLLNYAKKYYPDTFQDFNEGSFGSLMFDTVAYVGDIMSFYLDYQTNESFIDTSIEYNNILKLGSGLGYKKKTSALSTGVVALYLSVPANSAGTGPNIDYLPVIGRGTVFKATNGNTYTLIDDVVVSTQNSEIRKSKIGDTGPFEYIIKVFGKVVSGTEETTSFPLGDFVKFRKLLIGDQNVSEIISVVDNVGNVYYEVDYLTQNIIYKSIPNFNSDSSETSNILKPFAVARRFVVVSEEDRTYIQFGGASDDILNSRNNRLVDPSQVVLQKYGRDYTTDESFDPALLIESDKMGVGPQNTVITVAYRRNDQTQVAAPVGSINTVIYPIVNFKGNVNNLNQSIRFAVEQSLTVTNNQPITGESISTTSEELKKKIFSSFAMQNRAVTAEDYKSMCYNMPGKYGSIKRVSVMRDLKSIKKNLNIYVISQNELGNLSTTNTTTKTNLRTWISKNKAIADTIDILDAKIVNFGIYFTAVADKNYSKYDVLASALEALKTEFDTKMDIGESVQISRVYDALRRVEGILDVRTVELTKKDSSISSDYSSLTFNFDSSMTSDGMFLKVPKNVIMEIKYPDIDIEGKIV